MQQTIKKPYAPLSPRGSYICTLRMRGYQVLHIESGLSTFVVSDGLQASSLRELEHKLKKATLTPEQIHADVAICAAPPRHVNNARPLPLRAIEIWCVDLERCTWRLMLSLNMRIRSHVHRYLYRRAFACV